MTYTTGVGTDRALSMAQSSAFCAQHLSTLSLVNGHAFTMSPAAIRALAADGDVVSISPDHTLKAMDDLTDSAVGVTSAWSSGYDGTGIGVAIIDSGVNDNTA